MYPRRAYTYVDLLGFAKYRFVSVIIFFTSGNQVVSRLQGVKEAELCSLINSNVIVHDTLLQQHVCTYIPVMLV